MVKWSKWFGKFAQSGRGKNKGRWFEVGLSGERTLMSKDFNPREYYKPK